MDNFLLGYFMVSFIFFGYLGGLALSLSGVYEMEECLSNRKEFIRCLFMWQVAVYEATERYIKKSGVVLIEVVLTLAVLPCNALCLVVLLVCEIIRLVVWLFMLIFAKKKKRMNIMTEWTKVTDALPPDGEAVMVTRVYMGEKEVQIGCYRYENPDPFEKKFCKVGWHFLSNVFGSYEHSEFLPYGENSVITHWSPMPQPAED